MKQIIFAILVMFSVPALACEINYTQGLDDVAVQRLKLACEQAKLEAKEAREQAKGGTVIQTVSEAVTSERVSAFGLAAKDVAAAIGIAAKELGVAANDFLATPAGILVAAVVIWKLFAIQFIGLAGVFVVTYAAWWMIRRSMVESYDLVEKKRFWGLWTVTKRVPVYSSVKDLDGNQGETMVFTAIICAILNWILLGTMVV